VRCPSHPLTPLLTADRRSLAGGLLQWPASVCGRTRAAALALRCEPVPAASSVTKLVVASGADARDVPKDAARRSCLNRWICPRPCRVVAILPAKIATRAFAKARRAGKEDLKAASISDHMRRAPIIMPRRWGGLFQERIELRGHPDRGWASFATRRPSQGTDAAHMLSPLRAPHMGVGLQSTALHLPAVKLNGQHHAWRPSTRTNESQGLEGFKFASPRRCRF